MQYRFDYSCSFILMDIVKHAPYTMYHVCMNVSQLQCRCPSPHAPLSTETLTHFSLTAHPHVRPTPHTQVTSREGAVSRLAAAAPISDLETVALPVESEPLSGCSGYKSCCSPLLVASVPKTPADRHPSYPCTCNYYSRRHRSSK